MEQEHKVVDLHVLSLASSINFETLEQSASALELGRVLDNKDELFAVCCRCYTIIRPQVLTCNAIFRS